MLAGTNSNFYSLTEVNNILVVVNQLLNFDEPQLLKISHHAKVTEGFIKTMKPVLNQIIMSEKKLKAAAIEAFQTQQTKLGDFNRHHVLAFLFLHFLQKGDLFDLDRVSVIISWHLLHAGLKELSSKNEMDLDAVEGLFLGFMGELQKANQLETIRAIHNYLHISYQIVASDSNGMSLEHCAAILAPSLLEGLKLQDKIFPGEMPKEWKMMSGICKGLLKLAIFNEPFAAEKYTIWSLPKSDFYQMREKALGQLHVNPMATYQPNGAEIIKKQCSVTKLLHAQAAKAAIKKDSAKEVSEGSTSSPLETLGDLKAALSEIPQPVLMQFSEIKIASQSSNSNSTEESKPSKKQSNTKK